MQFRHLLLKTIVIFSLVGLAACSDDDATSNNDTPDSGIESPDGNGEQDQDALGDVDNDADEADGEIAEGDCEPGSEAREEVAREEVAQNEGVNAGEVTFDSDEDIHSVTIDAASGGPAEMATTSYIYIDLDAQEKLDLSDVDAFEDSDWDIAFNRSMIRLNNSDSGPGGWMAARVDAGWDDAEFPSPEDPSWSTDSFIADNCELEVEGQGTITTAFGVWYDYDMSTHTVTIPEDTTWMLYNMTDHTVLKLEIQSFDGSIYEIRWAAVDMGR